MGEFSENYASPVFVNVEPDADERQLAKLRRAIMRTAGEAYLIQNNLTGREYLRKHTRAILAACESMQAFLDQETGDSDE